MKSVKYHRKRSSEFPLDFELIYIFLLDRSNRNRIRTGLIIGAVVLGIIAAGVLPAVIVSQMFGTATDTVKNFHSIDFLELIF